MSSNQLKCVRVSYLIDDVFKIPKHINLEDTTQVKFWGVKWNYLHIHLTNGKELKISSEGWVDEFDFKHPSNNDVEIINAEELGIDDDDCNEMTEDDSINYCSKCGKDCQEEGLYSDGDDKWVCSDCRE
jgi:hypothetical protein